MLVKTPPRGCKTIVEMLTHMLRKSFRTDWATAWWRQHLPRTPVVVSVDGDGDLVLEWDGETTEDALRWSSGFVFKSLRRSKPNVATVCCCWHLCRQYDDCQETSTALTTALAARLEINIGTAPWYWDDRHGVLVSVAPTKGSPKPIASVKTKQMEERMTQFVLMPDAWLLTTLLQHLRNRAFPPPQEPK